MKSDAIIDMRRTAAPANESNTERKEPDMVMLAPGPPVRILPTRPSRSSQAVHTLADSPGSLRAPLTRNDVLHLLAGADGTRFPHLPKRRLVR